MNVPAELAELEQWVVWRYEERGGKRTKVPCIPREPGRRASSTDAATWGTLATALHAAAVADIDGIGFVFSAADPFAGVDLDACVSDGVVHPAVADIIARLDSYTELSPSGTGLHVIVRADVNGGRKRTASTPWGAEFENYNQGRFFCVTGEHLNGTPLTVNDRQEQLDAIRAQLLPGPESPKARAPVTPSALDDRELLERARGAKNGATFDALWRGDTSGHDGDHSKADFTLCSLLAFWTGPDPARIDGLFRQSALLREKWDERRGAQTYGQLTIDEAISGRTEFYGDRPAGQRPSAPGRYKVTWTEGKTPKLVLPKIPAEDDPAGLCAWLTVVFNLNPAHPVTGGQWQGVRGPDGQIVLRRADAQSLRFEPARAINTPQRLYESFTGRRHPGDRVLYAFKAEHCRQIAHVVEMLCDASAAKTEEQEACEIVGVLMSSALAVEGHAIHGTTAQRYEAAQALRRERGSDVRYLIDCDTGEVVIAAADLAEAARRSVGSSIARGWLDARMDGIGWKRITLEGRALPGRSGRSGPHAIIVAYCGHVQPDTEGLVTK
jgi:hypothetical protein